MTFSSSSHLHHVGSSGMAAFFGGSWGDCLGGGHGQGAVEAVAVISWSLIYSLSMSFSAFSVSCGFSNSCIGTAFKQMGVDAFYRHMSIILIFPEVENIFMM